MNVTQTSVFQHLSYSHQSVASAPISEENAASEESLFPAIKEGQKSNNTDMTKQSKPPSMAATDQTPDKSDADNNNVLDTFSADKATREAARKLAKQKLEEQQMLVDQQTIRKLANREKETHAHELAHASAGGEIAGKPVFKYELGPDGKRYAVGGHVDISATRASTPQKTIQKMQKVRAAALAPAQPSAQDHRVAAVAGKLATQAQVELQREKLANQELQRKEEAYQEQIDNDSEKNDATVNRQEDTDVGKISITLVAPPRISPQTQKLMNTLNEIIGKTTPLASPVKSFHIEQ